MRILKLLCSVCCCGLSVLMVAGTPAEAAGQLPVLAPLDPELTLVPQTLLSLIHAPEVLRELRISDSAFSEFRPQLQEIDGPWWRVRIKGEAERRAVTAQQEQLLMAAVQERFGESAARRLRQLELQAQGCRCLLRAEVRDYLQLRDSQLAELQTLYAENTALAAKAFPRPGVEDAEAVKELQQAARQEPERAKKLLSAEQQRRLLLLAGTPFDTSRLQRIYPLAPELVDGSRWVGAPVTLEQLRGKVVLVHFYAFQCGNCHANYPIYNRWQQELVPRGVRVIGIQTPETAHERDYERVAQAAQEAGFQFPILVDLQNRNWDAWSNTMWPTVYVIDRRGFIRLWWQGELQWQGATGDQRIEELVDSLLAED